MLQCDKTFSAALAVYGEVGSERGREEGEGGKKSISPLTDLVTHSAEAAGCSRANKHTFVVFVAYSALSWEGFWEESGRTAHVGAGLS